MGRSTSSGPSPIKIIDAETKIIELKTEPEDILDEDHDEDEEDEEELMDLDGEVAKLFRPRRLAVYQEGSCN